MYYEQEEVPEFIEGKEYTKRELELMADEFLREDARAEMCVICETRGKETGNIQTMEQYSEDGEPIRDGEGFPLVLEFPEYKCKNDHVWFKGEGKARGIAGSNPILFEEHLQQRRRREIFPANGTPDPSIVAGIYNRTHPQGRKVNSDEQRKKNGASWYR